MVKKRLNALVAGSLVCGLAGSALANDEVAELRNELASMRAELAQVKAQTGASWMDEAREAELRAMVEDVVSDASTRTAFQEGGLGAGHDGKKFYLEGEGFKMNIGGQLQFRYVFNQSDARDGDSEELDGFEIRRAKLKLDGHIGDPKIGYKLVLTNSRSSGNTSLEDAVISYKYDSGIKVSAGKMKLPFLFEELLSSSRQLGVDRGLSTEFFTLNRAEQIQVAIPVEEAAKVYLAYSDGGNSESSNATADTVDYAFTGRVQGKLAGEWSQMKDLVAVDQDFAAFVGGAIHLQETEGAGGDELLAWTVDGVIKTGNLAVMAAVMGASADVDDRDQFGILAQAGYSIDKNWQPFARFDYIDDDDNELTAITAGVNYYLAKHNAKFTADVVYLIEPENPGAVPGLNGGELSSGLGLSSTNVNEDDDQFAVRAQFQLLF
ncbi:MAG: porin [Planctomycetota bacterium]